jgi:membrane-bound lytic murein transglycosylase D
MTSILTTLFKSLIFTLFLILLTSCANDTNYSFNPDFSNEDSQEFTDSDKDDVKLENVESQTCLEEELIALSQTGDWDEELLPDNTESVDDVVFDFPIVINKQVEMYLDRFQNRQRKQFSRWLARSTAYQPMMEQELEKAGLPKDLVYLAMIESGFNQLACSRAKAVGLWQFMKPTGRQYNLRVDKYVDERRDSLKSTKAAVTYLSALFKEFGDWHLAVAAYNGGPGKVRSGLRRHNVDNFWSLASKKHLRLETKHYVPKLIAALLIAKEPEKYGFTKIAYQKPLQYDALVVGPGMSLDAIALISNSSNKQIKRLNLELKLGKTPLNRARYTINIPEAKLEIAKKNLTRLHSIVSTGYKTHKIRKSDTLTKISRKYGINKTTILKVNNLHRGKLAYGRNLRIPYSTITYQLLPEGSSGAMDAYKDSLVLHRIKKGDTISKIAKQYKVPAKMIVAWNGLKNSHSIRAGQQLALYIDNGSNKVVSKSVASNKSNSLIAAKIYKKKLPVAETTSPYQWYNVKNGDSLWTISRKFSASTADIKKWNNLKSNLIHPGSKLKLKKV